uniref:Uncharacterized protein n=1 Tax=Aegilops tauschii subsp. strangulata TaxID=200361 RepID=A0A453SMM8_AEGTS
PCPILLSRATISVPYTREKEAVRTSTAAELRRAAAGIVLAIHALTLICWAVQRCRMSESPCRLAVSLKGPSDPAASSALRVSGNLAARGTVPSAYIWFGPQLCELMQFRTLESGASWRSSWSWMPWRARPPWRNGMVPS